MAITPSDLSLKTTVDTFLKDASDLTLRRRLWMALLQNQGRIIANAGAWTTRWLVYCKEPAVRGSGDGTESVFTPHDGYLELQVGIAARETTSSIGHMQDQINRESPGQRINLYMDQYKRLTQSMQHDLGKQFYKSGTGTDIAGLNTPLGYNTCATTDKVASPNGSYGGKDTDLGDQGGTWSTDLAAASRPNATLANDWPYGIGSSEYDYLAPKFINTNCTNWGTGVAGFRQNVAEILSFTNLALRSLTGDDEVTNLFCMSGDHFSAFQNSTSPQQRAMMPTSPAMRLGFHEVYNWEGAMVNSDVNCPAGRTYVMNYNNIELFHVGPKLLQTQDEFAMVNNAYLFRVLSYLNMRLNPKFLAYIGDWTA